MAKEKQDQLNPIDWVDMYGDYLYNYACFRIRDKSVAEDMVQETFLSGLRGLNNFQKRSSVKTWLVTILKNKIIDYYRSAVSRETQVDDIELFNETEDIYYHSGRWKDYWDVNKDPVKKGFDPEEYVDNKEFWKIFNKCLSELPAKFKAVFVLREMEEQKTDDICNELKLSSSNVQVIIHRTRKQLRRCLEINWLGGDIYPRKSV